MSFKTALGGFPHGGMRLAELGADTGLAALGEHSFKLRRLGRTEAGGRIYSVDTE